MKQNEDVFRELKKNIPGVKKNIFLKNYTTFEIGGPAEYFFIAKSLPEVLKAVKTAKKLKLLLFLFGGGSNLLVSDGGLKGLVVKLKNEEVSVVGNKMKAGAGIAMEKLVALAIKKSLQGLEWAGGLPGSFGGAIRGNAGAFGGEMKDSVTQVAAWDSQFNLKKFTAQECGFSYRSSLFKEKNFTVAWAVVTLKKGNKKEIADIANSRIAYRQKNHPLEYPSAGSVFKNVDVNKIPAQFQQEFASKIKKDPFPIVPAAWFIIGVGLTGKKVGQAQISEKHSNYIVNLGGASAQDVLSLASLAKKTVKEKYGIDLEMEVQYVL